MRVRILPGAPEKVIMKVYKPFGPTIGKTKLSKTIVKKLNNFSDKVIQNKILSKKITHSLILESIRIVVGPSLIKLTFMSPPNSPV